MSGLLLNLSTLSHLNSLLQAQGAGEIPTGGNDKCGCDWGALPFPNGAGAQPGLGQRNSAMPMQCHQSARDVALMRQQRAGAAQAQSQGSLHQVFEQMMMLAGAAMMSALQGQNPNQFNAQGARGQALQTAIGELARQLQNPNASPQDINTLAQVATWLMIDMIMNGSNGQNGHGARAGRYAQNRYGIGQPGSGAYRGQGPFGSAVGSRRPDAFPPAPVFNGPPSEAGVRALDVAKSQVGVREASGRNDGLPAQRYSNGRREPWCANFVAWSFRQAGMQLPGNQRSLASVQYMEDQMKRTGQFHRGTPQPGDIIFFSNRGRSDRGSGRHVGIVERVENGKVYTVEGNSSNAVRRRSYDLNNSRISGYGRVGGANASSTQGTNAAGTNAAGTNAAGTNAAGTNAVSGANSQSGGATATQLNRVLGGRFAGMGQAFVNAGNKYGVDPKLLAAISMHETGNGTSNAVRSYNNPGGMMNPRTNWSTLQRFSSLEAGIEATARNLRRGYLDKGLTSVEAIQRKYAPVGAANDPTGLNGHWVGGVYNFLNRIG